MDAARMLHPQLAHEGNREVEVALLEQSFRCARRPDGIDFRSQ